MQVAVVVECAVVRYRDVASQEYLDAAAGGAFLALDVPRAKSLVEKIAFHQSWVGERQAPRTKGVHQIDSIDMLTAKMDLLLKNIESPTQDMNQIAESRITCETCGEAGHSGNNCPMTQEEACFIGSGNPNNSGFRPQQGWNSKPNLPYGQQQGNGNFTPSLKDIWYGQKQINDSISKKFIANDKILEGLASQIEGFNSVIKNQLSFNKMIETQVAQLAASCPNPNTGKLPGQPEVPARENVSAVTTRTGKSTRDPPMPQSAGTPQELVTEETEEDEGPTESPQEKEAAKIPDVNRDPNFLPFPERKKRPVADEQFDRFVEVIKKVHIDLPLLDVMQVPTYSKYIKDILSHKRSLPDPEMVKLTEECSAAILNPQPRKKKDPGCPTIACAIGDLEFDNALCDLGASVSVMPKVVFNKLKHLSLVSTPMCLQLADQSVRYPAGIAENVPVRVRNDFVPVDFVVLDMENDAKTSLILGRPFLSTANATIDVGNGLIQFNLSGGAEEFSFQPKEEVHEVKAIRETTIPSDLIGKLLESLCYLERRRHNSENAKRRIARKKFQEEKPNEEETKNSEPRRTKYGERRRKPTLRSRSVPLKDSKPEPSP